MEIRWSPAAAAVVGLVPRLALDEAMGMERAAYRLAAMMPPHAGSAVTAEVARRRELGMTQRAALESVGDDLVTGRWEPR